jgi:hypothetical protein
LVGAVCGASDSGARCDAADGGAGFAAAALSGLIALLAGRSRGSGKGSDDQAVCTVAVTIAKAKAAITGLKICTFPHCPKQPIGESMRAVRLNKS